jgi:RNA polymerase sigma-70 factor (ECF subfamily)
VGLTDSGLNHLDQRLRAGDLDALGEAFAMFKQHLWRIIDFRLDRRLRGRLDPDDLLQETYLAASGQLAHYAAKPNLSPFLWLRMMAGQVLIRAHRRNLGCQLRNADRERAQPDGGCPDSTSVSLVEQLAGSASSPSHAAARAELVEQLHRTIARMDPIDREVLALRHFEELTNAQVAEVLGIQQKAASLRYARALGRLKEALAQVPGFREGKSDA